MRQRYRIALVVIVVLFLFSGEVFAGGGVMWQQNGVLVCDSTRRGGITLASDGKGGAIIGWRDDRNYYSIFAQRVDPDGNMLWATNGVPVCYDGTVYMEPDISCVSDGKGGAIFTWVDFVNIVDSAYYNVFVQKIDSMGVCHWGTNGTRVAYADSTQMYPSIVSDGAGGCIVAWLDRRNGNADIYAQRVDSSGMRLWGNLGISVCSDGAEQAYPYPVTFGNNGVVIVWPDKRNGDWDVYGQRINGNGTILWDNNGKVIYSGIGDQYATNIVQDNRNGVIIVWEAGDFIIYDFDIYAQRLDSNGGVCWDTNGVVICNEDSLEFHSKIVSDGNGGIVVVWLDERTSFQWDVYVQRVDSNGICQWDSNGIFVNTIADTSQEYVTLHPQICPDNRSGAIVTWKDYRNGNWDIYCQRVDSSGVLEWGVGGLPVCVEPSYQGGPSIVSDGDSGAIIAWADSRYYASVYAQRVGDVEGVEETENSDFGIRNSELKVYPNPFTTSTTISFTLPNAEGIGQSAKNTELKIYDLSGRLVKDFSLGTGHLSLTTVVSWDGKGDDGKEVSGVIYFVKLKVKSEKLKVEETRKIIKLK